MASSPAKGCLVGCGVVALLAAAAELLLRQGGFQPPPSAPPIVVWNADEDRLMATDDYLFEADSRTLWKLRAGATIQFGERERIDGPPERVNADGFRGPRIPLARTPGVLRVATLGDSSTFGVGMHDDQTWSARLAAELKSRGVEAEVLNGGVDGYTIRQGIERWRSMVSRWKPDVVVAAFGAVNEHWPVDETDAEKMQALAAAEGLGTRLRSIADASFVVQAARSMADPGGAERAARRLERQRAMQEYLGPHAAERSWPFPRRVGLDEFRAAYGELQAEVEGAGARLIVVAMPRRPAAETERPVLLAYTRAVWRAAAEQRLQMLSVHARFRAAEAAGEPVPSLFIGDYWHPSIAGHAQIARWLAPMVLDAELNRGGDTQARQ